ncbi:MAG: putative peptide-modifying radical SAM/SPASM domain-containing protein, partial [Candidatus Diapherotrites archaeon]|nr:putative peptide-modifying radical SAM/SPASM domain-containing protein [Candidatus Diapherotrites archaeon]
YYLGHIETHKPEEIKRIFVNRDCQKCEIYWFCGGRCLYSNITKPWPKEGSDLVCESVKNLYENLNNAIPKIRELIRDGKIDISDFKHTKYNGCEIIP